MERFQAKVEREYLDSLEGDETSEWKLILAILFFVAEVRDLKEILDARLSSR